jgi:mannose-6-phosphate isomerase-like protein (cupin superfamily)
MQAFDLNKLLEERASAKHPWLEFLRVKALSMGVYHLQAGQADPQMPHTEDEVYYVISGRAQFRTGQQQLAVGPGSVIFVERAAEHRFLDVAEDLTVLVFFAPPEGSLK